MSPGQPNALNRFFLRPWLKPLLWGLYALPALWLLWGALNDALGANPAETLIHQTGLWTLRFLWLTLAITPLRELAALPALVRHRRALGVSTYLYACLHLFSYAWLDKGWVLADIVRDVGKRNFILVGMTAFVLMTPLALSSFNRAIRYLGGRRWQWLHKLVYVIAPLGLLHFYWKKSAKNDEAEVMVYAVLLALLLGWRVLRKGGVRGLFRLP